MTLRITHATALVLYAVSHGYNYGFEIIEVTGLGAGTVYPVLRRLEDNGLLRSSWERASQAIDRPPRRYYRLSGKGVLSAREAAGRYPMIAAAFRPGRGTLAPT